AAQAVAAIIRDDSLDPAKTILLGHSMGGEIAVRMADKIPLAATIAISPAPMVMPRRMPSNLLVFSAQFDVWQLKGQAAALQKAAGGDRTNPQDFAQQRAFDLVKVPFATHTSMLTDRTVAHRAELWAMQALLPQADPKTLALNLDLGTYSTFGRGRMRLAGAVFGLIGLALMLPLGIAIAGRAGGEAAEPTEQTTPNRWILLGEGMIGAMFGVLLLMKVNLLGFIHLYAGDYLASEALVMAIILLVFNRAAARMAFSARPRALVAAGVLAFGF